MINSGRINNPVRLDQRAIADEVARLNRPVVVQFSESPISARILQEVDQLCDHFGENLEVRFYGHYGGHFDATLLRHVPSVQRLTVDCLQAISNADEVGKLPLLSHLRFGVYDFSDRDFLASLDIARLESLSISENRKRDIDLSPLAHAETLKRLYIEGHTSGIQHITEVPHLSDLVLRACPKSQSIGFVNNIRSLKKLELVLGGRQSIDELAHPQIETLQILRVQGLQSLGNLARFPALRHLRVEDQIKLHTIDLAMANLLRISVSNCKALTEIEALNCQTELEELFIARTAADVERLMHAKWPDSLRCLGLFKNSRKWVDQMTTAVEARGLKVYGTGWY